MRKVPHRISAVRDFRISDSFPELSGRQTGQLLELPEKIVAVLISAFFRDARNAADRRHQQIDRAADSCLNDILMKADSEKVLVDLTEISGAEGLLPADRIGIAGLHLIDEVSYRKQRLCVRIFLFRGK